jgi:hypothetical protein
MPQLSAAGENIERRQRACASLSVSWFARRSHMLKKMIVSLTLFVTLGLAQAASAADEVCKSDGDCKDGKVCILALNPHVCKPPQPAGSPCKRDVVCASKKCEMPSGKDVGMCK